MGKFNKRDIAGKKPHKGVRKTKDRGFNRDDGDDTPSRPSHSSKKAAQLRNKKPKPKAMLNSWEGVQQAENSINAVTKKNKLASYTKTKSNKVESAWKHQNRTMAPKSVNIDEDPDMDAMTEEQWNQNKLRHMGTNGWKKSVVGRQDNQVRNQYFQANERYKGVVDQKEEGMESDASGDDEVEGQMQDDQGIHSEDPMESEEQLDAQGDNDNDSEDSLGLDGGELNQQQEADRQNGEQLDSPQYHASHILRAQKGQENKNSKDKISNKTKTPTNNIGTSVVNPITFADQLLQTQQLWSQLTRCRCLLQSTVQGMKLYPTIEESIKQQTSNSKLLLRRQVESVVGEERISELERAVISNLQQVIGLRNKIVCQKQDESSQQKHASIQNNIEGLEISLQSPLSTILGAITNSSAATLSLIHNWSQKTSLSPQLASLQSPIGQAQKLITQWDKIAQRHHYKGRQEPINVKKIVSHLSGSRGKNTGQGQQLSNLNESIGTCQISRQMYSDPDYYGRIQSQQLHTVNLNNGSNLSESANNPSDPLSSYLLTPSSLPFRAMRPLKPTLDRKASKCRKLKYQIHPKLISFMMAEGQQSQRDDNGGEAGAGLHSAGHDHHTTDYQGIIRDEIVKNLFNWTQNYQSNVDNPQQPFKQSEPIQLIDI